jgi:hypothetical protein
MCIQCLGHFSHQPFFVMNFFEIGSQELFSRAGCELQLILGMSHWCPAWKCFWSTEVQNFLILFCFGFLFMGLGFWTQSFVLAKLVLYCLSHALCPFFSGCFGDGGLAYLLSVASNLDAPNLSFPSSRGYRCEPLSTGWSL